MVAALVDRCREEAVLVRKRTREASIVRFCSDPWKVVGCEGFKRSRRVSDAPYRDFKPLSAQKRISAINRHMSSVPPWVRGEEMKDWVRTCCTTEDIYVIHGYNIKSDV